MGCEKEIFRIRKCEQGSGEWHDARLGKLTASVFDKIITAKGALSTSHKEMVNRAVAELIVGEPDETFQSEAMLRGKELEDQALSFFNFTQGYEFEKVGFCDTLKGYGCSPDGLDHSKKMGLELKCPLAHTHLAYLAGGEMPVKYKQQVQGSMLVTGFKSWVFGSYHPSLPCFSVEVKRDDVYIEKLKGYLEDCCKMISENRESLEKLVKEVA